MANVNKVFLMGNLTRDPELSYLPSNTEVCEFGIAVNRRWKSQDGEDKEEVTFVDCVAFGKTGAVIAEYMKKGRPIFVEGRLKLDQWEAQDGTKRSKMRVVVESFQFLGSNREGDGGDEADTRQPATRQAPRKATGGASKGRFEHRPHEEDDIPF